MRESELEQLKQEILSAFDKALTHDCWNKGLLFQTTAKNLRELREYVNKELAVLDETEKEIDSHHVKVQGLLDKGYVPVFISLHQAEGAKMDSWVAAIKTLVHHNITRPVYRDEQQMQAMIRHRMHPKREGYVVAYVKKGDILPPYAGKVTHDKLGYELLTLRDGCIAIEHIIEFIHDNKRYVFRDGKLVALSE